MNAQTGSTTGRQIADASAIGVIATVFLPWIQVTGLAMLLIPNLTGLDLITGISSYGSRRMFAMPEIALTPLAGLVCLVILIYSHTNPTGYSENRKSLSIVRIVAAMCGAIGPLRVISEVTQYGPMDQFAASLSVANIGPGVYAALITLLVVVVEAVIDMGTPTSA